MSKRLNIRFSALFLQKRLPAALLFFFLTLRLFSQTPPPPLDPPTKESDPDYTDAIISADDSATIPENDIIIMSEDAAATSDSDSERSLTQSRAMKKTVWADGVISLTFPLLVTGDFSIYRQTGKDPFRLDFGHETATGYNNKPLSGGYFDHTTHIDGEKTFSRGIHTVFIDAFYNSIDTGLQGKSSCISDIAKIGLGGRALWTVDFLQPKDGRLSMCALDTSAAIGWYGRYSCITKEPDEMDSDGPLDAFEKKLSIFDLSPRVAVRWGVGKFSSSTGAAFYYARDTDNIFNKRNMGRADFFLTARYDFITKRADDTRADGASEDPSFDKTNKKPLTDTFDTNVFSLFGKVSCLLSNCLDDKALLIPFDAGLDMKLITGLSTKRSTLLFKGGLKSFSNTLGGTERGLLCVALDSFQSETADWYCALDFSLPIKEAWTFNLGAQFLTTALDLGYIKPLYGDSHLITAFHYGQYRVKKENMTQLNTNVMVSFTHQLVTCYLDWQSFWLDVPVKETTNKLSFNIALQDKNAFITFSSNIAFFFGEGNNGEDADYCPEWDFELAFRTTNNLSLCLFSRDFIKLVIDNTRSYCDSVFIKRGGVAGIAAKFMF